MAVDPQLHRLVNAYGQQVATIRARVLAYVNATWGDLSDYRDADIARFVKAVIPVVAAGRMQTATLTDAYLATVEATVLGRTVQPVGVTPMQVSATALRGTPDAEVYSRVGPTVWTALSKGADIAMAASAGLQRAQKLAATDMQLAKTHTTRRILTGKGGVAGYRRVIQGGASCALCIVASTQRYHSGDLMPIHPACDCGVLPIYGDHDPGRVIDPDSLDGVHDRIAERFGASDAGAGAIPGSVKQYRDALVTHEHGEIGPVLAVRGQAFTSPSDL